MRSPIATLALLVAAVPAFAAAPAPPAPPPGVKVAVYPPDVNLETARDRQSFVVQATEPNGLTRDVTAQAQIGFANPTLVKLSGHTLAPAADGQTEMTVTVAGQTVRVPVKVTGAAVDRPVSFKLDVMPVFLRAGCNSGGCHGAARGKDGFRLSLFGFDPDGDHTRLCREMNGRRINLALPAESLLLEKACGKVPHTGGKKIAEGDEYHATIMRWLEADAPLDPPTVATPVSMEVYPPSAVLDGKGEKQRLVVRAKYSDGTDRDVTSLALFLTNNENAAKIAADGDGTVTAGERGEAFVMARFHTFTVGVPFITLPKGLQFQWPAAAEHNYVDQLVNAKLKKLRIEPSGPCTDEVFVRRVYLDVIGTLPTPEEYARFMVSTLPNKRELLVDELLDRKEFAEVWVLKWAELLQIRTDVNLNVSRKAMLLYYEWLQDKISRNVPTDVWVRELLSANGGTFKNAATNYYQLERDVLKVTENVAQVFMGMRIQCAQCHNHPFTGWKQTEYWGMAQFFYKVQVTGLNTNRGQTPTAQETARPRRGKNALPDSAKAVPAKFLQGPAPALSPGQPYRPVLAAWLTSPTNPFFAKAMVNRTWAGLFGRGLVDPVDDMAGAHDPSHPELLDALAADFAASGYDLKHLVRAVCNSHAYQRSSRPTGGNEAAAPELFARMPVRVLAPEQLFDSLARVTGFDKLQAKARGPKGAGQPGVVRDRFAEFFLAGADGPNAVAYEAGIPQALRLMNSRIVNNPLAVRQAVGPARGPAAVERLYLSTLSRRPTADEAKRVNDYLAANGNGVEAYSDVLWALLNSSEFAFVR